MSEFCKQCSLDLFGEDYHDFRNLTTTKDDKNCAYAQVLCEGCGVILVNSDGECVSPCLRNHKQGKKQYLYINPTTYKERKDEFLEIAKRHNCVLAIDENCPPDRMYVMPYTLKDVAEM